MICSHKEQCPIVRYSRAIHTETFVYVRGTRPVISAVPQVLPYWTADESRLPHSLWALRARVTYQSVRDARTHTHTHTAKTTSLANLKFVLPIHIALNNVLSTANNLFRDSTICTLVPRISVLLCYDRVIGCLLNFLDNIMISFPRVKTLPFHLIRLQMSKKMFRLQKLRLTL